MTVCTTSLANLGSGTCPLKMGQIVRFGFVSQKKEDGTYNKISKSNAATLSNWQTLFDKPNFSSSILEKVVMTDIVYEAISEADEPIVFDQGGYYEKLADGNVKFTFRLNSKVANYVKKLNELSNSKLSFYAFDDMNQVWGAEDGTDLVPLKITKMVVTPISIKTRESVSYSMVTFQLENPADMHDFYGVEITDGDIYSDTDFYSLVDVDTTLSSPAVTGCVAVLSTTRDGEAVTGFVYGDFVFYDNAAPSTAINLANASSLTESPDGTYTINEALLLTSGHTYKLKISHSGYDVEVNEITVP